MVFLRCMLFDAYVIVEKQCNSYAETVKSKEFKTTETKGLLNCEIRSIIVSLLVNHYLRWLKEYILWIL